MIEVVEVIEKQVVVEVLEGGAVEVVEGETTVEVVEVSGDRGERGEQGEPGPPGSGSADFLHHQEVPAAMWDIEHGLGGFPFVAITDEAYNELVAHVQHASEDRVVVRFDLPLAGWAILRR